VSTDVSISAFEVVKFSDHFSEVPPPSDNFPITVLSATGRRGDFNAHILIDRAVSRSSRLATPKIRDACLIRNA